MHEQGTSPMVWKRTEEFIHENYYPTFETKTDDWCYYIHPIVKPKKPEAVGFHVGGWSRLPGTPDRMRIEAQTTTFEECMAICEGHMNHVKKLGA